VLVTSGRFDAMTPALLQPLLDGIRDAEAVVFEENAHIAMAGEPAVTSRAESLLDTAEQRAKHAYPSGRLVRRTFPSATGRLNLLVSVPVDKNRSSRERPTCHRHCTLGPSSETAGPDQRAIYHTVRLGVVGTSALCHGLGRRRRVGVRGSTGVRLRAPVGGSEVTMSGSWRVFSAWSIAAASSTGTDDSIGLEKTRLDSLLHTGHSIDAGAVPMGRAISNAPSRSHRYSYSATAFLSHS
jgi:hypothetical protein